MNLLCKPVYLPASLQLFAGHLLSECWCGVGMGVGSVSVVVFMSHKRQKLHNCRWGASEWSHPMWQLPCECLQVLGFSFCWHHVATLRTLRIHRMSQLSGSSAEGRHPMVKGWWARGASQRALWGGLGAKQHWASRERKGTEELTPTVSFHFAHSFLVCFY